jgi:hypothetical protein
MSVVGTPLTAIGSVKREVKKRENGRICEIYVEELICAIAAPKSS